MPLPTYKEEAKRIVAMLSGESYDAAADKDKTVLDMVKAEEVALTQLQALHEKEMLEMLDRIENQRRQADDFVGDVYVVRLNVIDHLRTAINNKGAK